VSLRSGTIRTAKSLLKKTGTYRFTVKAVDEDGSGPFTATASVEIIVKEAFNSLPVWVTPPSDNMTISVLEVKFTHQFTFQH